MRLKFIQLLNEIHQIHSKQMDSWRNKGCLLKMHQIVRKANNLASNCSHPGLMQHGKNVHMICTYTCHTHDMHIHITYTCKWHAHTCTYTWYTHTHDVHKYMICTYTWHAHTHDMTCTYTWHVHTHTLNTQRIRLAAKCMDLEELQTVSWTTGTRYETLCVIITIWWLEQQYSRESS